jgi:CubicO group peptidase (beta-lactamase class C family)
MVFRRLTALLAVAAFATLCRADKVDDLIESEVAHFKIPGAQVAIVQNGRILKVKSYGTASLEFGVPVRPDTALQIASATKVFTGVAAMMLVEQGKISLDDPVSKYFPEAPKEWDPLRIWHLLSFTSGLEEGPKPADGKKQTDEEVLRGIMQTPLNAPVGTKWRYNQAGLTVFLILVKKLTGKAYPQFMTDSLFAPLGMRSSSFGGTTAFVRNRNATAYTYQTGDFSNWIWPFETGYGFTGTGLNTTAGDVALFLQALQTNRLLKKESLDRMWASVQLADGKPAEYGLCWDINKVDSFREVGHEGGGCAWIRMYPERNLGIAFLCNLSGSKADRIHRSIAKLYLDQKH